MQSFALPPRLIIVLGMHRSGTSLTTNLLHAFGVKLSDDLMEPSAGNERGYFESKQIVRIHDDILNALGMDWQTSDPIPSGRQWWRSRTIQGLKRKLSAIASREIARHGGLWAFKDPRTARVLPVWIEIARELGIAVRYVLALRHPSEVAESLRARNGIDAVSAEKLWLIHNLDAIVNTSGQIDAIVDYRNWLERPVDQMTGLLDALDLSWSGTREEMARIMSDVVAPELHHSEAKMAQPHLPLVGRLYDMLSTNDVEGIRTLAKSLAVREPERPVKTLRGAIGALGANVRFAQRRA
jgi:hypothetical protein